MGDMWDEIFSPSLRECAHTATGKAGGGLRASSFHVWVGKPVPGLRIRVLVRRLREQRQRCT